MDTAACSTRRRATIPSEPGPGLLGVAVLSFEIVFVLSLLAGALVLLMSERVGVDVVAVGIVVALAVGGILTPAEALGSFASEFVFVLVAIFILSGALSRTGVMELAGRALRRWAGDSEARATTAVMSVAAGTSALLSNTSVTAVLMPAVMEYADESRQSPGKLLLPLAYASMLGGVTTLLGTSANIAANALVPQLGLEPFRLFEFLPVGIAVTAVGTLYMVLVGRHWLPRRESGELTAQYAIRDYLAELTVEPGSALVGEALQETDLRDRGVTVVNLTRAGKRRLPVHQVELQAGDTLLVKASREVILAAEEDWGLIPAPLRKWADADLRTDEVALAEAMIMPRSHLDGRTLRETRFRQKYGVTVLAVYRRGHTYPVRVRHLELQVGDVLLLRGPAERLQLLQETGDVWILGEVEHIPFRRTKGGVALAALAGALVLGGSGLLPLSIALLLAVLVIVLARVVPVEEVYELVEWQLLVLIGGMASLGLAMQQSGAAELLAEWLARTVAPLGLVPVMAGFSILTMLLTQPLSNAAAGLVMLPVAVATATQLGIEPRTFAVLVTCSASLSFATPLEPACLLVYGPGRYRFRDFVIAGVPMSLLCLAVLLVVVPLFWPT